MAEAEEIAKVEAQVLTRPVPPAAEEAPEAPRERHADEAVRGSRAVRESQADVARESRAVRESTEDVRKDRAKGDERRPVPPPSPPQDAAPRTFIEDDEPEAGGETDDELLGGKSASPPKRPAPIQHSPAPERRSVGISGAIRPIQGVEDILESPQDWSTGPAASVPMLFLKAGRESEDVLLQLDRYQLYFSSGHLVRLNSPDGDGVVRQLVRSQALRQQAADKVLADAKGDFGAAEKAVADQALVPPAKLLGAFWDFLVHHAPILAKTSGRYTLRAAGEPTASLAISLDRAGREIFLQTFRSLPPDKVRTYVEGRRFELAPTLTPGADKRLPRLKLSSRDERFVERLDGSRPLSEVAQQSPMSKETLYHLLLSLVGLGLLELGTSSGVVMSIEEKLRARLSKAKGANPFRVLEVHWTIHPEEVEEKLEKLRKELGDDLASESAEARALGAELFEISETAGLTLMHPQGRHLARKEIVGEDEMHAAFLLFEKQLALEEMRTDQVKTRRMRAIMREIGHKPSK
ncbi:MAG: hypothetical protein HY791_28040 [Deltaproteobacteria bacterium]|nr:hypothetical protein [Deltaproteobacteria bacterium]